MAKKKENLLDEMPIGANDSAKFLAQHGVTQPWLANILGMDRQVVNQKLANCPKLKKKGKTSGAFYDITVAMQYLIPPLVPWEEWITTAKKSDIPAKLKKEYFDAKTAEIAYRLKAGELFTALDIERELTAILITIKGKFQSAPAEIEKTIAHLTPEIIDAIHAYLDDILNSVRKELILFSQNSTTESVLSADEDEIDPELLAKKKEFLDGISEKITAQT